jgi:TolB protein
MSATRIRWLAAALLPLVAVAIVLLVNSGSAGDGSSEPSTTPSEEATSRSEYSNIHVLELATRKDDQITSNDDEQFAGFPSWSANGKLVFSESRCEGCAARLFETDATGSERRRIPSNVANSFQPSWSPNGRRIAVTKPGSGIYVIDAGTGRAKRLSSGESDEAPAWSPDGKLILFQRQVTATNWDIYAARPSGGLRRITRDPGQQLHPAWSTDGRRIAYAEQHPSGNWVIYTANADGSNPQQITSERDSSQDPSWSPDGNRIAFVAQAEGRESVAVIGVEGTDRTLLTGRTLAVTSPSWSPDGRRIAFGAQHVGPGFGH